MENQSGEVEKFFSRIAEEYKKKYSESDAFLYYFFNERLAAASRDIELRGKTILDIGAGTGNLYDHLRSIEPQIDYYATDISNEMLVQSSIPGERRFVGDVGKLCLPLPSFDFIFVLGVTSYMAVTQFTELFESIDRLLTDDGKAIVTFTNKSSADWKSRKLFKLIPRRFLPDQYVLTQEFTIYPRTVSEIRNMLEGKFTIKEIRWLNHTLFPFNQIFKKRSVALARWLHDLKGFQGIKNRLSSDFMVIFEKNKSNERRNTSGRIGFEASSADKDN